MPILNVTTSADDLANIDPKRLLKAVVVVMLEEINVLRQKVGLAAITAEQARQAIIAAYKNS